MNIGETIIVKAWKNFSEMRMTCIGISEEPVIKEKIYEFDNGFKLFNSDLENNIKLWNSRNGYEIL